jgi:multiple sugar transport system ATP-binding protein
MATIKLEGLEKRFGNVVAVAGIDLAIGDGEFVVLVGPSGCGKSTTLRMVAGLEPVSAGKIKFDQYVVNNLTPKNRDIAMVFQSYALYPHMTVFDNMSFGLRLKGVGRDEIKRRVQEAAAMLNITELLARKPRELSGGQRQRVAMGRAIVRQPKAFLFDEPLSNLDASLRAQMRVEIKRLHKNLKTTVIYVTHDQIEAMTLADRIVIMKDGRIVQVGRPMEVYEHPVDRFVASFIGAPKMNFLPGRVEERDGELVFAIGESITLPLPPSRRAAYLPCLGRPMELGIRPEHLHVGRFEGADAGHFEAVIDVVEPMGSEGLAFLQLAGVEVAATCDPHLQLESDQLVPFTADLGHCHLIESDSGRVVPHDDTAATRAGTARPMPAFAAK